ncbi:MAG: deoxyribose-phosphate aldolase [Acidimicrobiales bacterium]
MTEIDAVPSPRQAGKAARLRRIFGDDGRCVIVPLDHGSILGRVPGLEDPMATLRRFFDAPCDGFLLGPGVLRRSAELFGRRSAPARILTMDVYWRDAGGGDHRLMTSVETAAALGVDGVKILMPWDVPSLERARTAALVAGVVEDADRFGLPVMVEPMAFETTGPEAVAVAAHGCRVAAEIGADILKIAHPGDDAVLRAWCEDAGVPVVLMGGGDRASSAEVVALVKRAVEDGMSGIVIGRKLWGRPPDEAARLLSELHALVHG